MSIVKANNLLNTSITLHASEHRYILDSSQVNLLRNFAYKHNYLFSSMIGGCDSIRDIRDSLELAVDNFEVPCIDSIYSLRKLFSALEKVYIHNGHNLTQIKIFINIGSRNGSQLIKDIYKFKLPSLFNSNQIIFNFNRHYLVQSFNKAKPTEFDHVFYLDQINNNLKKSISILKEYNYLSSVSGFITKDTIETTYDLNTDFIKTNLFSIPIYNSSITEIKFLHHKHQLIEANILSALNYFLNVKINNPFFGDKSYLF